MKKQTRSMIQFFLKIILPALLAVIFFIITLFFVVIPVFEDAIMGRKKEMIKELTNTASSILEKYHMDEKEGLISKEEAQETAISRIQYLRYGEDNKDYFWITDMHPNMIMHPYRQFLNGTDLTNYEDSLGRKMFVKSVDVVKNNGHGYIEYMWQWKDDSTQIVSKLSYVKGFEPWGWIIGTGIYIEDVKNEISKLSFRLVIISVIIASFVALLLTFISLQSLKIERKKQEAEKNLKESREKYRSLVEASTEGLIMISENKIIFANTVFLNTAKISFDELAKMNLQNIFKLPETIIKEIEQGKHNIKTKPFETELLIAGKEKTEVLINITPILFYGKKALILSIKDIRPDKLIKQELFESRERFKTLMDKLKVGIFRTTLDKKGKIIEANETALNLLGFNEIKLVEDKYILDLFAEVEDKKSFREKLLKTGFIKNQVIKLIRKDNSICHVIVSLAVIKNNKGKAVYCDGIIEPFSSKKTEPQHSSKLIETDDLRDLLNSISIKGSERKVHTIKLSQSIKDAHQLMEELASGHLFIKDNENTIIGYITDKEIAAGLLSVNNITEDSPVFNIMKSPIIRMPDKTPMVRLKEVIKKTNSQVILTESSNGAITGYVSMCDFDLLSDIRINEIFESIEKANTIDNLKSLRIHFIRIVSKLVDNSLHYSIALQLLSEVFDKTISRLFMLFEKEHGAAPAKFSFIVMGSEGRNEQTLKTDQDNAIVYSDAVEDPQKAKVYFQTMGTWICNALDTIGYSLCKGGNMAMVPQWNQPLSIWKKYFYKWINTGHAKDLLDINIFFDFRLSYGSTLLIEELQAYIIEITKNNPAYLHHLAKNTMLFKPSVNIFGNVVVESAGAPPDTIYIKDSIAALVNFARVYALQNGIKQTNTLERLQQLNKINIIDNFELEQIQHVLEYLTTLRLKHQAMQINQNINPDNYIGVKNLTEIDKTTLKKVLSIIGNTLSKLDHDFNLKI